MMLVAQIKALIRRLNAYVVGAYTAGVESKNVITGHYPLSNMSNISFMQCTYIIYIFVTLGQ